MKQKRPKILVLKYILFDYFAAIFAWLVLFTFRKKFIETPYYGLNFSLNYDSSFILGLILVPLFWLLMYYVAGEYHNVYRKSRLQELGRTIFITTLGVIFIFFVLILDDTIVTYHNYYQSFFVLLAAQFSFTYLPRVIITSRTTHRIHNHIIGFKTIIIGSNERAVQLYHDLVKKPKSPGNEIVGFVTVNDSISGALSDNLPQLGSLDDLIDIINQQKIEEVIIAIEPTEREKIHKILVKAKATNAVIKAIPDLLDILTGSVRMSSIFGVPLIELSHENMAAWQENIKRVMDVFVSIIVLILLFPFFLFLAIGVKLSSKGPIFYSHERIGRYGKPFAIYKFRSMVVDAEKDGPALSSKSDTRITNFGRFMRKMRFDEFPQFFNVLKGDMALVGPRPERLFYIEQIVQRAPHYHMLFKVRPGITSWGQVKFGYAENIDEMVERLKYDIIYLENMSLYVDIKILIYTLKTVFEGSGK